MIGFWFSRDEGGALTGTDLNDGCQVNKITGQYHNNPVNLKTQSIECETDVTYIGAPRMKICQVAVQKWNDGKIINERFYYSTN